MKSGQWRSHLTERRPFHIYCPIFACFGTRDLNIFVRIVKIGKGKAVLFLRGRKSNYIYACTVELCGIYAAKTPS